MQALHTCGILKLMSSLRSKPYNNTTKIFFRRSIFLHSPCPNLEGIKICSPTSSKDSQLVRIVVPCAQTRLPRPRGHGDAFSSLSKWRKRRTFRQACSVGHRASSEVRGDVCSCHGLVVDSTFERSEFEQLLLACSEGCGLHHNIIITKFGAAFICTCVLY